MAEREEGINITYKCTLHAAVSTAAVYRPYSVASWQRIAGGEYMGVALPQLLGKGGWWEPC